MRKWWRSLSIATKLNVPIQLMLLVTLSIAYFWIGNGIDEDILNGAEKRLTVSADGVINGMNMLMLTGVISNPDNRRLFIKKMADSANVKELQIIRAKQVQDQFGIGLPEEQVKDEIEKRAISSKQPQFLLNEDPNFPTLRAVVPFIVSTNFRGTNCLMCHHVEEGSVNGAANIVLDMSEDFREIQQRKTLLMVGIVLILGLLSISIHWLLRRYLNPLVKLQLSMNSLQQSGSMETFVPIEIGKGDFDEISKLTTAFNKMSAVLVNSEKSMKLAESIYKTNAHAIVVTDEKNLIIDVNPAFTRITGYPRDEVLGQDPKILQSGRHDQDFYKHMWQSIVNNDSWFGEIWDKRKNGEIYPKSVYIHVLRRADGTIFRHIAQFFDISEKKQKEDLIFWHANYDALTELPNRRLLYERLGHSLATSRRNDTFGALMFLDMDKFKVLNDTLGHDYGDMLLIEVAKRLKNSIREEDTVARIGGDEFVVLIENVSEEVEDASFIVAGIAEKIRATLALPYALNQYEHFSSPSIGVYLYDGKIDQADEVLKRADMAMYQAKDSGRNAVRFFDPKMQESVEARSLLEADLHRAIPDHQFELYYQIQLDSDYHPVGAEALIRWRHPTRGQVPPGDFIPVAEGSPLILEIGQWVLDAGCQQIALWSQHESTRDLVIAINISGQQFQLPDFENQVAASIRKYGINPSKLKIELTEGVALNDINAVVEKMSHLRNEIGVSLSLDDFGTGYSSLSYLKRLPLDQLKIDKSFVNDITSDESDAIMVKTIIDMAHNFGLNVIAEGVETEDQLSFLIKNGCQFFQGYYFSRPLPLAQFEALIAKYHVDN